MDLSLKNFKKSMDKELEKMRDGKDLIEKYCWECENFTGDTSPALCGPYADPTEDWCEVTGGELDLDELESESDFEPGSEEHHNYLITTLYEDMLSTGYYSEEEIWKIIEAKIKDALEWRKCVEESIKNINPEEIKDIRTESISYVEAPRKVVKEYERRHVRMVERKKTLSSDEIKDWIIKMHKWGEWYFHKLLDEYGEFLRYKLTSDDKFKLNFALQELIDEKKIGFKEGKTYLIEKV
jgi:hypothetical protein